MTTEKVNPYVEEDHLSCIRAYLRLNRLSQRELNRLLGSRSSSLTNSILKGKLKLSNRMMTKLADLMFGSQKAKTLFVAMVVIGQSKLLDRKKKAEVIQGLKAT